MSCWARLPRSHALCGLWQVGPSRFCRHIPRVCFKMWNSLMQFRRRARHSHRCPALVFKLHPGRFYMSVATSTSTTGAVPACGRFFRLVADRSGPSPTTPSFQRDSIDEFTTDAPTFTASLLLPCAYKYSDKLGYSNFDAYSCIVMLRRILQEVGLRAAGCRWRLDRGRQRISSSSTSTASSPWPTAGLQNDIQSYSDEPGVVRACTASASLPCAGFQDTCGQI